MTGAEVMTGNFATDIAVQDRGDGRARLIIPMRGDPSVTWVDWDGAMLSCATDSTTCDDVHRLASIHGDATISDEPFEAYVDSANEFAVVSHFSTGVVTLVDSPRDGDATFADPSTLLRSKSRSSVTSDHLDRDDRHRGSGAQGHCGRRYLQEIVADGGSELGRR